MEEKIKISAVTDEISSDFETAVEIGVSWGIRHFELRGINVDRVPLLSDYWKERIQDIIAEYGIEITAISPGIFKIPFPNPVPAYLRVLRWEDYANFQLIQQHRDAVQFHLNELLPRSIEFAKYIGTKLIIIFSFDRAGLMHIQDTPDEVLKYIQEATKIAREEGITLALENEHICWGNTGKATARIVREINSPNLRINWDPANSYACGDVPFPDGYHEVKEYIVNCHYKDAIWSEVEHAYRFVFDGKVNWEGQIKQLKKDGYSGFIAIETHVKPKIEYARKSLELIRNYLEAAEE
jgi:sugar phosphate isomerase/epimerase